MSLFLISQFLINIFQLGNYRVSPDNQLLAYSADFIGNERYVIRFRDLTTGEELPDQISDQHISLEWSNDSTTVFFDRVDDQLRPFMIVAYTLGSKKERIVFVEKDPKFQISLKKRDRFMMIDTSSILTSETWIIDANQPFLAPRVFQPRQFDVLYTVEYHAHGAHFFVLCNADRHRNFTMYYTPTDATSKEEWTEFLPYDPSVSLQGMCCFRSHVVIFGRQDFKPYIRVVRLTQREEDTEDLAGRSHFVTFVDPCYNCWIDPEGQNEQSNILRLTFSSLTVPDTTYDYNMDTRELIEVKRMPVRNYKPDDYQSEMLYTRASDGTKVAISIVYRRGLERHSQNPCLMYGYGAYGSLSSGGFSVERLSLLDRGFVFAFAHVRGSGDNGRIWYEEGKLMKKRNTFLDFIKCTEKLIRDGYTSEEYLSLMGRSAGGLLVSAVLNIRPDLFKAALVQVPFIDCINTLMDPTYPLTVNEYEEWGNPNVRDAYEYIATYSPYDNIRSNTQYPNMFITGGYHDARVRYWEPAKYVAKLRSYGADGSFDQNVETRSNILLHTSFESGHFGSAGRYDSFSERATDFAFLIYHLLPSEIPKNKVHLIFDPGFSPPHPAPRSVARNITSAGYICQTYFVTPDDIEEQTQDIPTTEIVFLHCDLPADSAPGSTHEVARFLEERFQRLTGALAEFVENTTWRSVQNRCLAQENVPHVPCVRIEDTSELAHRMSTIEELGTPLFISVDSARKFREEALSVVAATAVEAARKIGPILRRFGPVVCQRFIVGREFTVAVSHEHRVYGPCEKLPTGKDEKNFLVEPKNEKKEEEDSNERRRRLEDVQSKPLSVNSDSDNDAEHIRQMRRRPSTLEVLANKTMESTTEDRTDEQKPPPLLEASSTSSLLEGEETNMLSDQQVDRRSVRLVDVGREAELVLRLQQLAVSAYRAVKGSGYGRVEIVQEASTGELYVLDIVPLCATTEESYFQTSTRPSGGVTALLESLIQEADK